MSDEIKKEEEEERPEHVNSNDMTFVWKTLPHEILHALPFEADHCLPPYLSYYFEKKEAERRSQSMHAIKSSSSAPFKNNSYMDRDLKSEDKGAYKAAGLVAYRLYQHPTKKCAVPQILMGVDRDRHSTLVILGGKREPKDSSAIATAVREFVEETGNLLKDKTALLDKRCSNESLVAWIPNGKFALYFLQMKEPDEFNIDATFREWRQTHCEKDTRKEWCEMNACHWIDVETILANVKLRRRLFKSSKTLKTLKTFKTKATLTIDEKEAKQLEEKDSKNINQTENDKQTEKVNDAIQISPNVSHRLYEFAFMCLNNSFVYKHLSALARKDFFAS